MSVQACRYGLWLLITLAAAMALNISQSRASDTIRLAVFDMELQDASHEGKLRGKRADETARVAMLSVELRKLLAATQRYEFVDMSAASKEIAGKRPLRSCNGCDVEIAKRFGATQSVLGVVYKVSNLILELHLYLRDTETGKVINHMHANIRGNNDKSWLRGLRWLIRNRLESGPSEPSTD